MKLCELKKVLVGDVNIYERNPDFQEADGTIRTEGKYRYLYTGSWNTIPEELLQREIFLAAGGTRLAMMVTNIQLENEPGKEEPHDNKRPAGRAVRKCNAV